MRDIGATEPSVDPREHARRCVLRIIRRIQCDPDVHYLIDPTTETFQRICEAYAYLSDSPLEKVVEGARQKDFGGYERRLLTKHEWIEKLPADLRRAVEDAL